MCVSVCARASAGRRYMKVKESGIKGHFLKYTVYLFVFPIISYTFNCIIDQTAGVGTMF